MCVNDFSRYTWVDIIQEKPVTFDVFKMLCEKIKNEQDCNIVRTRSDHEKEFENSTSFEKYCNLHGISHKFSYIITPQQNGVVERKNKSLYEMGSSDIELKETFKEFMG